MLVEDPLYGPVEFTGVAGELLAHPALERLRGVHQNGGAFLVDPAMDTSRFEHTVGVAALCRRFGAGEREVLAAILHDVGHTAFSHVADHLFERADQGFHEDEVGRVVDRYDLDDWLATRGFDAGRLLDADGFGLLEQDLPDCCADRLDYQLRDLHACGLVDRDDVDEVLAGLVVEDGRLVAADRRTAARLVDVSLLLQRQVFFDARHEAANLLVERLLAAGLDRDLLTVDDLFGTDRAVLDRLRDDPDLAATLDAIGPDLEVTRRESDAAYTIARKRRSMDPLVAGTGRRASELVPSVRHKLEAFRANVPLEQGYELPLPVPASREPLED